MAEPWYGMTAADLAMRYKDNEALLVKDLMDANVINPEPPQCHGKMVMKGSDVWKWRCTNRSCCKEKHATTGSFFDGYRNRKEIFSAIYGWSNGDSAGKIVHETHLSKKTVTKLLRSCRAVLEAAGACNAL